MAKRWYSISVLSNFEKKVAEQIRTSVEESGLTEEIEEILVPTEGDFRATLYARIRTC